MITVANGPYTGLGLTVAPEACLDDGHFDVHVFSRFSRWELVRHLLAITLGRRRYSPQVDTYQATHVRIDGPHPHPARADSEDLGETPVEFAVRPRALRVVAPADRSGAA
jgi:diacylglycerol kinase family enzyme